MDVTSIERCQGRAPFAAGHEPEHLPTLEVFSPPHPRGSAVPICPGGGNPLLAAHERTPVGKWPAGFGIAALLLRYRHASHYRFPKPQLHARPAMHSLSGAASRWRERAIECLFAYGR